MTDVNVAWHPAPYSCDESQMLRVLRMGPIIRMQVHEKRGNHVHHTVASALGFVEPKLIPMTYIDWRSLADPSQSDMPLMKIAVARGLYSKPEEHDEPYGISFTWRRTEAGDAALKSAAFQAQDGADKAGSE